MNSRRLQSSNEVTLTRTDDGGLRVDWNGHLIGWLHASIGDRWNAFLVGPDPNDSGRLIGKFTQDEAIRRIALEAGGRQVD